MSAYNKMHIRFRADLVNVKPIEGRAMQVFSATVSSCMEWIKAVLPKATPEPKHATPIARIVEMVDVERAVMRWDADKKELVIEGKCEFCPATGDAVCCVCGSGGQQPASLEVKP